MSIYYILYCCSLGTFLMLMTKDSLVGAKFLFIYLHKQGKPCA